MVPGGLLGRRGTLGGVGSSEGGGVGRGCEDYRVVHHEVSAGGLFCPCNITPVGVVLPPEVRSGGQILHGDREGYSCWEFCFGVAWYKGGG